MLNIKSVLKEILNEIHEKSNSIEVIDDMHFIDKTTGVEFHLYDDYFQVTKEGEKPVSISSFSDSEQAIIMELKNAITDPLVTQDKLENHDKYLTESRLRFSNWYENPTPTSKGVIEEEDTIPYVRS